MLKKKRVILGGVVVLLSLGFLLYRLVAMGTPSMTVGELLQQQDVHRSSAGNEHIIQVAGKVMEGSVQQDIRSMTLKFSITDIGTGQGSLPVVYKGVAPDTFKTGNDTLVEGYLDANGVFQASKLSPKCPSKYVPV